MKSILRETRKHLDSQGETYFQHMHGAWKIVFFLNVIGFKCFIHSIIPGFYPTALSEKIGYLEKLTKRKGLK